MREVIATGKTVEEAIENGCLELGLSRDEVSVEIIEMQVKKLFKTIPAKVKITADDGLPEVQEVPVKEVAAQAKPVAAAPVAKKQENAEPARAKEEKGLLPSEPEKPVNLENSPGAKAAADYLMSILNALGVGEVKLEVVTQGDATLLRVESDKISEKMEIRGETIQALSYLIDKTVNAGIDKRSPDYLRIRLDISGYRNRRETELIALAKRSGEEVAKTGRSRTLAPMNPYERLIVHTAVSKISGIMSESIGADVERRVVIKSLAPNATDGGDWRPPSRGGKGRGDRSRNDSRGKRDRNDGGRHGGKGGDYGGPPQTSTPQREYADKPIDPNAAPIVPVPRDAIKDGEDLPLYGKIDF